MSKNVLQAVERLVDELNPTEKRHLYQKLERTAGLWLTPVNVRQTRRAKRTAGMSEWDRFFAALDQRRKGRRFAMAEIVREVKAYRREHAGG